jgi:hypothetical protein
MRRAWCLVGAAGLLLAAGQLRPGEQPTPRQILDQAIKAHGGEQNLVKYKAATLKDKGTYYGVAEKAGQPYTTETAVQGAAQLRFTIAMTVEGQSRKITMVINGAKGWRKIAGKDAVPLSKAEMSEEQAEMYAGWLTTLAPLKGEGFKLRPAGEVQVGGKPALGIHVERQGRPTVSLFFDKKSHLLVKSEFPVRDVQPDGKAAKEVIQSVFFHDYKDVQGVQEPTKIRINRDGKRFIEAEVTEIRLHESLEPGTFAEP